MPPVRTQAEFDQREHRDKLTSSYQSLLSEFHSSDLQSVGNYALGRLIGKGSFGKVYLAQHKLTNGSKVVLKSASKSDPNLAREIHHHRQFLHPHIARLYEVIVTENLVWLALEWCPGDELYNHLLQHGRMEPAKVQKIFTQLIGAVSYVHQKSCVHRDLKLENILLDKNENVKLVDFGFTREYQGTTSYLQTWCGTVCYSAPEMLRGEKYAGEKVDVWSLGVILFALLCGELPYDEDDDTATKAKILKEEPQYPDHLPDGARELVKKLLSKRPLLRPSLADVLKDPWLAEHAPQQQEILKVQQPPPFSTQLEKDTLQRMRSAGVNIDTVIEHVLAQRCDSLAGWWSLLIEKEHRKEKRRERKRKEREAEARSLRRLSAASSKLLALGEIHEGEVLRAPGSRGRSTTRLSGTAELPTLPKVPETNADSGKESGLALGLTTGTAASDGRSPSRPPPPPKDYNVVAVRRSRAASRGSGSMLRTVTNNPDLLGPQYVPPPQRKRRALMQQPLKEQLAWVKHWFKEGAYRRGKSPGQKESSESPTSAVKGSNGSTDRRQPRDARHNNQRDTLMEPPKKISFEERPNPPLRAAVPTRPRLNTSSSIDSRSATQRKRQSLSPGTLTPHSSVRRSSAGLRGRKSTSSSVSSIRSTYQAHHQHTHSKASSTSSASIASPSGLSSTSAPRLARSPHSSVKILPSTPTGTTLPAGIRVSRRPPPSSVLGQLPIFAEPRSGYSNVAPASPSLPVFARRKRSVFKGPHLTGSPSGFNRGASSTSRSGSVPRRTSIEIPGITEEDEEEEEEGDEDDDVEELDVADGGVDEGAEEEVDHFDSALRLTVPPPPPAAIVIESFGTDVSGTEKSLQEPLSPFTPGEEDTVRSLGESDVDDTPLTPLPAAMMSAEDSDDPRLGSGSGQSDGTAPSSRAATPLTAEALAKMQEQEERRLAASTVAATIHGS